MEIKVSLSVSLQGSNTDPNVEVKNVVFVWDNKQKKHIPVEFYTKGNSLITQTINISKEAYNYMTSQNDCPEWEKMFKWKQMNKITRLDSHMKRISDYLGGLSYSYQVFDE